MLDRLTNFLSAFFHPRERSQQRYRRARLPGGVSKGHIPQPQSGEDVPVETPQADGPGQVRYSFSTARMIAL